MTNNAIKDEELFLIFDTETTGLFNTKDKPKEGIYKARDPLQFPQDYPRVFQLAFVLINRKGEVRDEFSEFIIPDGWEIPKERDSPDVPNFWEEHGYSDEQCRSVGVPAELAFTRFAQAVEKCDYLIAHNLAFDRPVILAELGRYSIKITRNYKPKLYCTMMSSINYVNAPHSEANMKKWPFLVGKAKFPKLMELHEKLFSVGFDSAHNALEDVKATFRCLMELMSRGIMSFDKEFNS